ncbi:apolipoprotein N-acyltransferase [Tateyamaria omphalii]|uniref:apolipoprotein N-acyltransferase n=1 Tax=Tateyamaria omphalii TaxID=299262 RepID=UPI001C99CE5B|nr:apolipoprotein N-acyltransferase [Tateyamaria omphalii]MBY5934248.1 apolipoprotein N-acyltransferase [Tateyamaria omphalii]
MRQLSARLAQGPLWVQAAAALLAGALGALSHAPFDLSVAILIPLIAAFGILSIARSTVAAGVLGVALGAGYFAVTLNWITEPFQVDAATTGWMAPFALLFLSIGLGLFWGAALAFSRWACARAWVLVFALTGAEILRAYVLTGFPWATPPQALVGGVAGQALAWGGPHGTMLLLTAVAGLAWSASREWTRVAVVVLGAAVIGVIPLHVSDSLLTEKTVRLVQPNAPQDEKWDPARIPVFINRQIDYTADGDVPDLVVWPETALPYLLEQAQPAFDVIADAARGAPVVLGIQRSEAGRYYNSLAVLDATGQVTQTYDKHHLVPFGEYMPLPGLFRRLGIQSIADRVDGGYTSGPGPQLLDMGTLGMALPLICYEAVFAHDVGASPERPDFLMQLTNDAWFGMRSGPQQHLVQAQMRAIEQGLPLIRAANTGISAVVDPKGRITAALALNQAGYVDALLPAPGPATLYSRTGDLPWVVLIMLGLIGAVLQRARTRRAQPIDAPAPEA